MNIGGDRFPRAGALEHRDIDLIVTIRPYRPADASMISGLIRNTMSTSDGVDYLPERLRPLIEYFLPEKVDALGRERDCLVAEDAGEIVGTGALDGDELVTFFVTPERQRTGSGSALLSAVERIASERGVERLRVEASLAGAPFYRMRGYTPTDRLVERAAGVHVAMLKTLPGPGHR